MFIGDEKYNSASAASACVESGSRGNPAHFLNKAGGRPGAWEGQLPEATSQQAGLKGPVDLKPPFLQGKVARTSAPRS